MATLKALTICQPFAHLICLPPEDDRAKRVENRKWDTTYRGKLLIHAGKSRKWLELNEDKTEDEAYNIPVADMTFGAIVAVCNLAYSFSTEVEGSFAAAVSRYPWLLYHEHVEGPFCFVLTEVQQLAEPIPCGGLLGLWTPSEDILKRLADCGKEL